jgi:hypothetical protein
MNHALLIELINGQKSQRNEEPLFLRALKDRLGKLDRVEAGLKFERTVLEQVIEIFDVGKKPKGSETPKSPEAEPPKEPEKIDAKAPPEPVNPRRRILEDGIKKALKAYRKAPLSKRFKGPKRMVRWLSLAIKANPNLTEFEHITRMEAAIGEALTFLQTSKLAARSNVLKEVKKILEETMDKRIQV